jgi:hypothetical protein
MDTVLDTSLESLFEPLRWNLKVVEIHDLRLDKCYSRCYVSQSARLMLTLMPKQIQKMHSVPIT